MVFKMGGDDVRVLVVRRMLHRAEVVDLLVLGDDHHAPGVLAGGALYPGAPLGQAEHLGEGHVLAARHLQVLLHIANGGLLRHRADGARPEHVVLAKQLEGIPMGAGLILPGEVQVDIRHFVPAKAQEGLKGDIEPVLLIVRTANRTFPVRHIRTAAVRVGRILGVVEVGVLTVGAAVVGGQRVDLSDARQEGHQGGAYRAPGTNQVTVLQGVLYQLLGRHVDHIIVAADDILQLSVDAVHHDLGRVLPVKAFCFPPYQIPQFPLRILQLWGE